jgi:hypothetical protein
MTLRAVLACAAVLAVGCRKKQQDSEAPPAPAPLELATGSGPAPEPGPQNAPAPVRDRCRDAVEHAVSLMKLPDPKLTVQLAEALAEACRSDGWSDELIACVQRGQSNTDMPGCKLTDAQQKGLVTRMMPVLTDAGISFADAKGGDAQGADSAPESATPSALEARALGYAKLLAIDVSVFQFIESYPGAPEGTTFSTTTYSWRPDLWIPLDAMQREVEATVASIAAATPTIEADAAVRPYAEKLASWLPRLIALIAYYEGRKFVDDEFDRGRREAGDVRRTATELGKLRGPMRAAVHDAWRELVSGYRDSPRALATHAWIACMSVADRVMERAKPSAINKALSECRRSIPGLAEAASTSGFDATVRGAASELGDWIAQGYPTWRTNVSHQLGRLTLSYVELWPKLPTTPAERPAP